MAKEASVGWRRRRPKHSFGSRPVRAFAVNCLTMMVSRWPPRESRQNGACPGGADWNNWSVGTTDESGFYSLDVVPGEETQISYDRPIPGRDRTYQLEKAVVHPKMPTLLIWENAARPSAVLGTVVDQQDHAVAGVLVKVFVEGADAAAANSAGTNSGGEFRVIMEPGKQGLLLAEDRKGNRLGYAYCTLPPRPADYKPRITLKPVRDHRAGCRQ